MCSARLGFWALTAILFDFMEPVWTSRNLSTSNREGKVGTPVGLSTHPPKDRLLKRNGYSYEAVRNPILSPAISVECFRNMALRLLVNSAVTLKNSRGDLTAASL
jgi:hypothetical protein